jgi:trehalose 6-phosphate phosphatase
LSYRGKGPGRHRRLDFEVAVLDGPLEVYESGSRTDNGQSDAHEADLASRLVELLGAAQAGLVTDVDGTISPIVARPEEALVLPRARQALEGLKHHLAVVAVVSGRSAADARQMVDVDGLIYVGNHGLEVMVGDRAETVPEARPWLPRIAAVLDEVVRRMDPVRAQGVLVENKGASASLHYRLAQDQDATRREMLEILARYAVTSGLRVEEGRRVINLLPPLTVSKGSAVSWLVREHDLQSIVYFGDDITDAHAFRALDVLRGSTDVRTMGIGVVGPETPPSVRQLSDAWVSSVEAVAELLCTILGRLEPSDTMDSRAPSVGSN